MDMDYFIVISDGGVKVIQARRGSKPANLIRRAPTGIGPGDEKYIKYYGGNRFSIDWDAKERDHKGALEKAQGPGFFKKIYSKLFGG